MPKVFVRNELCFIAYFGILVEHEGFLGYFSLSMILGLNYNPKDIIGFARQRAKGALIISRPKAAPTTPFGVVVDLISIQRESDLRVSAIS